MAAGAGLVLLTSLVLVGWIAAPRTDIGLTGVLRAAVTVWLIAHHVGFALRGEGQVGMLPLGLVLLPGALLWRAGRWLASSGEVVHLRQVWHAAVAVAVPYGLLATLLAIVSRSSLATPSVVQAAIGSFLLALLAGGLGAARAAAPLSQLVGMLPVGVRSVVAGALTMLGVLIVCGAVLAAAATGTHLTEFAALTRGLQPGLAGTALLTLAELAYVPNAAVWAISFTLGPGFAVGTGTSVAPTGSALGKLPDFPMLAALPPGLHAAVPGWLAVMALAMPYLAGCVGGWVCLRLASDVVVEAGAVRGFASAALASCVLGVAAAVAGGPLGSGRLSAIGPSGWQTAAVAVAALGVAAAVTAGLGTWLRLRRGPPQSPGGGLSPTVATESAEVGEHTPAGRRWFAPS